MSYASLMVHLDGAAASEARVRIALDLAGRFSARLIGVATAEPWMQLSVEASAFSGELAEAERREIEQQFAEALEQFRKAVDGAAVRHDWRSGIGSPAAFLAHQARPADLLILAQEGFPGNASAYYGVNVGDVLLEAGRPVLAIPPGVATLAAERIVVGWKDTREARRAVSDALPLLARAKAVIVTGCVEGATGHEQVRAGIEDVSRSLNFRNIPAHVRLRLDVQDSVADELIRMAGREGADLIVAGAYGHSRLREWIFGGVTRDLLARSPVACLLAY